MASIHRQNIFPSTALTADATGTATTVVPRAKNLIGYLVVSGVHAATTVAAKIQHSPDGVNGWTDYLTFTTTAAGATANQVANPTSDRILPWVRGFVDLGGATLQATVSIDLYYEPYQQ